LDEKGKSGEAKGLAGRVAASGRELMGKVKEYIEVGAEEVSRLSGVAKMKVDLETLRFRKANLCKELGKRVFSAWEKKRFEPLPGTEPLLREIADLEEEIRRLHREISEWGSREKE